MSHQYQRSDQSITALKELNIVILISIDYVITGVFFRIYRCHSLDAPTPRSKKTNPIITRSIRHQYFCVVPMAWLCEKDWSLIES